MSIITSFKHIYKHKANTPHANADTILYFTSTSCMNPVYKTELKVYVYLVLLNTADVALYTHCTWLYVVTLVDQC